MHSGLKGLVLLACAAVLHGQAQPQQQPAGLETEWDIAVILREIAAHAARLLPALDRVNAAAWVANGASETYAAQLDSAKAQTKAVEAEAKALAANPENLSQGLQLLFRIEGIENMLASVGEGLRKYQSPADAQTLAGLAAENGMNRDRFRRYIVTLAAEREKQFEVMDREAQRCRGILAAQPSTPPTTSRRKK